LRQLQINPCDLIPGWDVSHELMQMRQLEILGREGDAWLGDNPGAMDVVY